MIHRKDFIPSNTAVVCVDHFVSDNFVIRGDRMGREDGCLSHNICLVSVVFVFTFSEIEAGPRGKAELLRAEEIDYREWCVKNTVKSFKELLSG